MNMYTAPVLVLSPYAPTAAYDPSADIETACPKLSFVAASLAVNIFCSVQEVPSLINTYAAPEPGVASPAPSSPLAPTMAYNPSADIDT